MATIPLEVILSGYSIWEIPMLGEIHCLINDFPNMEERIIKLTKTDQTFAQLNDRYNALDEEIRQLELKDAPIADTSMHSLKHERAELKDKLYQSLVSVKD